MPTAIELAGLDKSFTMHLQDSMRLPVLSGVGFAVGAGECAVLAGPSGSGKSSILRMIYGGYRCDRGRILVRQGDTTIDIAAAEPRQIIALRRHVIGYVSQFLRALPRVATIDVVAEPLVIVGVPRDEARYRAANLLRCVNIPERLFGLSPATFSGGEQQRVNIARGFLPDVPILLLDEPTASLDVTNRTAVVKLIAEKKRRGVAILAVVHDDEVRTTIADTVIDVTRFAAGA